jgi:Fe-S cluster biogenesis protein NfuA
MYIEEIEYTPNPNAVKFILDEPLTALGISHTLESVEEAEDFPMAKEILEMDHVESVFFGDRWLTITQDGEADWRELMKEVAEPIRETELDELDSVEMESPDEEETAKQEDFTEEQRNDPRLEKIREVLGEEIMPYLKGDGGGLDVLAIVDKEVKVEYQGACDSCPASITGTLMAIERLVQDKVDEELEVDAINDPMGGGGMGGGPAGFF